MWFSYTGPLTNVEVTITRLDNLDTVSLTEADSGMLVHRSKGLWVQSESGKTILLSIRLREW